jgi:hypothetical protein
VLHGYFVLYLPRVTLILLGRSLFADKMYKHDHKQLAWMPSCCALQLACARCIAVRNGK